MHLFNRILGRTETNKLAANGASAGALDGKLRSCQCTQARLTSETFQAWGAKIFEPPMKMHRKIWEYCYILQALYERDMLAPGRKGLGFAVGREPLSAMFASLGCEILATDLVNDGIGQWTSTGQHADSLADLNLRGICDPDIFQQNVSFRDVDMNHLPDALGSFDFLWSCCSLEHLGTLKLGEKFIFESLKYLKPGGVAVHTTEYNLESNFWTSSKGDNVIYRKRDLERIGRDLRAQGYKIDLDFTRGNLPNDFVVDKPPYDGEAHLSLILKGYATTSFGLIIEK